MREKNIIYYELREHLRNFWIGLTQNKFRSSKERPDSERYVKRRTKRFRTVKRRFGTSFGCFLISYITGILMYFSLMSLVIGNRNNQADVGFLSSLSILS